MRTSLTELIERANDVKVLLNASSFKLFNYDDGAYIDFEVARVYQPKELNNLIGKLDYKLLACENSYLTIRIFEDFNEY